MDHDVSASLSSDPNSCAAASWPFYLDTSGNDKAPFLCSLPALSTMYTSLFLEVISAGDCYSRWVACRLHRCACKGARWQDHAKAQQEGGSFQEDLRDEVTCGHG